MLSNRHVKMLLVWAFLTTFIMLSVLGIVAAMNYSKISENYNKIAENDSKISEVSNQTCGTVGGRWVETTYQFICVVDKEWKQ